ncbi:cell envelope protein SmpA [Pseudomonas sp. NA-150]|uniref:cell envelope protein SmpA n=1 Tax=Pseudomonas sp. NA-150 TaxID=3367525 RepID=UPI0037C65124
MRITTRTALWVALLGFPLSALSTTVQRCEDPQGNVTFTTLGCPADHRTHSQNAYNAPPGSTVPLLPEASGRAIPRKEVVVVGQRDDGCGNLLSDAERRRAIINQQTRTGMTLRDVESALGKPDKISSRNGETRYVYSPKKGRSHQVVFDQEGCVKGKR